MSTLSSASMGHTGSSAYTRQPAHRSPPPTQTPKYVLVDEEADEYTEADEFTEADEDDDDAFCFNAPAYYDLRNPALEMQYVNNADGYFALQIAMAEENHQQQQDLDQEPEQEADEDERMTDDEADVHHDHLKIEQIYQKQDRPETFEEVFMQYASEETRSRLSAASQMSTTSSVATTNASPMYQFMDGAGATASRYSSHSTSSLSSPAPQHHNDSQPSYQPPPNSKILQPTQSYLRRIQADQAMRQQNDLDTGYVEDKPPQHHHHQPRLTQPKSPRLHTSKRTAHGSNTRMSSTSMELLKIQEEKMRLQMESLRIREMYEKTKAHRPPANVHQRSTKPLTIPQSPHLEVGHRARCFVREDHEDQTAAPAQGIIRPETLVSREFALQQENQQPMERTVPQSPFLATAQRAARRNVFPEEPENQEQHHAPTRGPNGLTVPVTPQLQTTKRAQAAAAYRKPVEIVDKDAEELANKFHYKPVNRKILEPTKIKSPMKINRPPLTVPVSPNLSTSSSRSNGTRQTAAERAAIAVAEVEKRRKEREEMRRRNAGPAPAPMTTASYVPRRPVIPETPPLKSLQRHRQYQADFQRKLQAEQEVREEEMKKQREFKAQPMRVNSAPPRFEGSSKPLTEIRPFALAGERFHERSRERLELLRRQEEEEAKASVQFKAMPMPVSHDPLQPGANFQIKPTARHVTKIKAPELASERRAAERAAFDAAERERRAQEEAFKQQMEAEKRQLEEEELKRMRREKLTFHARPVPEVKPFELKPTTRPLTEPQSPYFHPRSSNSSSTSASTTQ